ncbi:glutathione peroxidase [Zhengella sp. ZM62]|uniref:glutathione peroxidase n=1 Tax=Zhengella sedimenti TaxID=3390035 RepID=UPI003976718B
MMHRRAFISLAAAALLAPAGASAQTGPVVTGFTLDGLDGNALALSRFSGKVLLVVNTASKCAFTPQYEGLEALWRRYAARGLVVIGVPSNDFGRQEPGSASDIKEFCTQTYDVTFPMAGKTVVRGANAHPLYKAFERALGRNGVPGWNFHKVLIGRDGIPSAGFASRVRPGDPRITLAIEAELARTPPRS